MNLGKSILSMSKELPLIPMKELVVFPRMVVPFFADKAPLIKILNDAHKGNQLIFTSTLKSDVKIPLENDFHTVGTIAKILQLLKLPDGTLRVIIEGQERASIQRFTPQKGGYFVLVKAMSTGRENIHELKLLEKTIREGFKKYNSMNSKVPPEVITSVENAIGPDELVDVIAGNIKFQKEQKLQLLSAGKVRKRLELLAVFLVSENEMLSLQKNINVKVRKRMEQNQKEYFLNEKLKEINKELGKGDDLNEAEELEQRIIAKNPPQEVLDKALKESGRLSKLQAMSPESGVLRTYLEWLADLPWNSSTTDNRSIEKAAEILDKEHYGMKKPKERILDFIAVRQIKEKLKGPILCFVGPPGTGKTSLGKSVAHALGRQFVRISLGGVRDEAEIRGHRKTYVGALPGKIIQSMKKADSINPVFLLDEIDKLNSDFRGDPASALLEVLDPEQNSTFVDHYLEVPYDLSGVMFITTANSIHSIPYALRDRMEIIEIPGYTEFEKTRIAQEFIIPKQLLENGLDWADISFQKTALLKLIREYTMESGVRNLEREVGNIIRKIARDAIAQGKVPVLEVSKIIVEEQESLNVEDIDLLLQDDNTEPVTKLENGADETESSAAAERSHPALSDERGREDSHDTPESTDIAEKTQEEQSSEPIFKAIVTPKTISRYLGKERFQEDSMFKDNKPGIAYGMAWTEMGGTLLPVEASVLEGSGELILTGSLGDVMKESAKAAHSFIRAHSREYNLPDTFPTKTDIHVHVPEGAIPKDGPSAGITLITAMLSALTGKPVREKVAMTGEITLTGRVLAIGGLKEKVLAAHRNKISTVLVPENNRKDADDFPKEVLSSLEFKFVDSAEAALKFLFPDDE
ncbi:MAG: endopeptidase La [Spirochaetales bacterium]|nr:endopeptidase La [Spirochaetales bacterium]